MFGASTETIGWIVLSGVTAVVIDGVWIAVEKVKGTVIT